ncbi:MAG: hypothetical protein WDN75_16325 [Bacteroidota bacterium]
MSRFVIILFFPLSWVLSLRSLWRCSSPTGNVKLIALVFFMISSVFSWAGDYKRFEENGKIGLKDESGAVVLPASFDALGWSDGNFSVIGQITGYRQNNHWGLLNLKKEFITKAEFSTLTWPGGR